MDHNAKMAAEDAVTAITKLVVGQGLTAEEFGDAVWAGLLWNMTSDDRDAWATALAESLREES